jgi:hypothetical protein
MWFPIFFPMITCVKSCRANGFELMLLLLVDAVEAFQVPVGLWMVDAA